MDYDMATAKTGVAAHRIHGETHVRGYSIPTKRAISKAAPSDITHSSVEKKKAFVRRFDWKDHIILTEYSMLGRQTWALLTHRPKEGGRRLTQSELDLENGSYYPP
jgi:hypothetical protein